MIKDKAQFWKDVKDLWEALTPIWMFRSRPDDFSSSGHWICPGLFWLQGLIGLLAVHIACFAVFFMYWFKHGYRNELLVSLAPLLPLWIVFVSADIKFRLQRPTKAQRTGFDNAVINQFGLIAAAVGFLFVVSAILVSGFSFLWKWLH